MQAKEYSPKENDTKAKDAGMKDMTVRTVNTTKGLTLEVHSVRLMNMNVPEEEQHDTAGFPYECHPGQSVEIMKAAVPEDELGRETWDGVGTPYLQDKAYAAVMCRILQNGYPIWHGETAGQPGQAYAPIEIRDGTFITLTLEDNSNWLGNLDGRTVRILVPIEFDPTVEDWK